MHMLQPSRVFSSIIIGGTLITATVISGVIAEHGESASLGGASVTLSNSRPSFKGVLDTGNTAESTVPVIKTDLTANRAHPSGSAYQFMRDDVVTIGSGGDAVTYDVTDIVSQSQFTIDGALTVNNSAEDTIVYNVQGSTLVVKFTTVNAVANGSFRVFLPAAGSNANDGIPDGGTFDFGAGTPTVTCANSGGTYAFTPSSVHSANSPSLAGHHEYICSYTGAGGVGNEITITINFVINPAPRIESTSAHVSGEADAYNVIMQHKDNSGFTLDSTTVQVGVIEAVRVTASVAPQLTFTIQGINAIETKCGVATSVQTFADRVPIGELFIPEFINAAQKMLVSTNAVEGYTVTLVANSQLGRNGDQCVGGDSTDLNKCIPHAGVGSMTSTVQQTWTNTNNKGFAYSLQDNTGGLAEFTWGTTPGTHFSARHFSDAADAGNPVVIFDSLGVADNNDVDICYRAVINPIQAAGNYEATLRFTATAKF
jgi:hypothetical protein